MRSSKNFPKSSTLTRMLTADEARGGSMRARVASGRPGSLSSAPQWLLGPVAQVVRAHA